MSAQRIAESILGQIDWETPDKGLCRCPGAALHTHPGGKRDCRVTIDGAPTVHCFHTSCKSETDRASNELRRRLRGAAPRPCRPPSASEVRQRQEQAAAKAAVDQLRQRARASLPMILAEYATDPAEFFEASPVRLDGDPAKDWRLLVGLFAPAEVVWIGPKGASGHEQYATHWRPAGEWLAAPSAPAPFICPSVFKPGSYARTVENVTARRFLVVESDTLTKADVCAVFRWCMKTMRLRAIVDTGGKSLHGWFDTPAPAALERWKIILPELQCDRALFNLTQPVRLPGWPRTDGKPAPVYDCPPGWPCQPMQALLYLDNQTPFARLA